jgi:SAM-dependent methyltransferase
MPNYTTVTETPSTRLTREALAMQLSRYAFAANLCSGKDVLEIGCGPGLGLGYLAREGARIVIGGDYTEDLLVRAAHYYNARAKMVRLDANSLPFRHESLDLIVLFETIYYLKNAEAFLNEARGVLRPSGQIVISTINREWQDFNPSPFSTRYPSAQELAQMLEINHFQSSLYGGFRIAPAGSWPLMVSSLKRTAVSLNLIPKTMKGKEYLKRVFLGPLRYPPHELMPRPEVCQLPEPLHDLTNAPQFKVIYAVAKKNLSSKHATW